MRTPLPDSFCQQDNESQHKHGSGIVSGTQQHVQGVDLASEVVQTSGQLSICGMCWTNGAQPHSLLGFNDLLLTTRCQISQHRFRARVWLGQCVFSNGPTVCICMCDLKECHRAFHLTSPQLSFPFSITAESAQSSVWSQRYSPQFFSHPPAKCSPRSSLQILSRLKTGTWRIL